MWVLNLPSVVVTSPPLSKKSSTALLYYHGDFCLGLSWSGIQVFPIWERSCDHGLTRHGLASFGKFKFQKLIIRLFPKVIPICSTLFSHSVSNADLIESEAFYLVQLVYMGMYLLSLRWREIRYAGDEIFSEVRLAPMPLFTLPVHVYWNRMANWQSTSPAKLWEAHFWARCGARHHTWTQTTRTGKFCNWPHDRCCWSEYIGCIQQPPGLLHHHDARRRNASLPANRVMQVRCITSFGLCICPRSLRFQLLHPPPPPLLRLSTSRMCTMIHT